ncbi:MAG: hypothetical protein Q9181_007294, partial [Wetmoreana brouardii]
SVTIRTSHRVLQLQRYRASNGGRSGPNDGHRIDLRFAIQSAGQKTRENSLSDIGSQDRAEAVTETDHSAAQNQLLFWQFMLDSVERNLIA